MLLLSLPDARPLVRQILKAAIERSETVQVVVDLVYVREILRRQGVDASELQGLGCLVRTEAKALGFRTLRRDSHNHSQWVIDNPRYVWCAIHQVREDRSDACQVTS
jgi:hypothetical protein